MTTQTKTEQLADELESTPFLSTRYEAAAKMRRLEAANAELIEALLVAARSVEALKRECSMNDPESAQATRNTQYMSISYAARAAIKNHGGAA